MANGRKQRKVFRDRRAAATRTATVTIVCPEGKQLWRLVSRRSSVPSIASATGPRGRGPACGTVNRGPIAGAKK